MDGSGYIAVHEQGVADVNVLSVPSQDSGPFEFTTIHAYQCVSETALCVQGVGLPPSWNAEMASLSAQGWSLIETTSTANVSHLLIFILRRPVQ